MKVGIIGAGRVGRKLALSLEESGHHIAFMLSRSAVKIDELPSVRALTSLTEDDLQGVSLVVEAATPEAVRQYGPLILQHTDFSVLSTTALSDCVTQHILEQTAQKNRTQLTLLAGGIVGLDGLLAVRSSLVSVEIRTVKTPAAWGIPHHEGQKVLFNGTTRQACGQYPRNVNVHASVAHASIGFDRCRSLLVSDPSTPALTQLVEVRGEDFGWTIQLHSQSIGGVSGSLTPRSVLGNVNRLLAQLEKTVS